MKHTLENKIVQAWNFLKHAQKDDGHFEGLACANETSTDIHTEVVSKTPFTTSLILNALRPLKDFSLTKQADNREAIDDISSCAEKAVAYLLRQKDTHHFAWNYWEVDEPQRKTLPYDLDDTSLACAAIQYWQPKYIHGENLAQLAHILISTERETGGPYNTWITDFKKDVRFDDCDIAVNANIAYMANLLGIHLPNLDSYFETSLENGAHSKYYQSPAVILYFISRGYKGKNAHIFVDKIATLRKSTHRYSPQEDALLLSALHYFCVDISNEEKSIENIIDAAQTDTTQPDTAQLHWKKEIFYFERGDKEHMWYHMSDALTTSICLEALTLFHLSLTIKNTNTSVTKSEVKETFQNEWGAIADMLIANTTDKNQATHWVSRINAHEWIKQCILLPYFIVRDFESDSLSIDTRDKDSAQKILQNICYANLAGWVGYSLVDDITDQENGANETMQPFANFCIHEMDTVYKKYFSKDQYKIVRNLLAETKSTDSKTDGQKSIGAAIAGLAVIDETYFSSLISFFRYFLEAKQMSDDMEDLISDLARGNITITGERVLMVLANIRPQQPYHEIKEDKELLLSIFWNDVYPTLHDELIVLLQKATMVIAELPIRATIRESNYFIDLIVTLQQILERTHRERRIVQDFLKVY